MSSVTLLMRGLSWSIGGVLSGLVLLVAIVWGMHESSALRPGHGLNVPSSLVGTNVVITGSSAGIGFEAALEFYKLGAHVVVHSSDQGRAMESAKAIQKLADTSAGRATPLAANLGDWDEVRNFSGAVSAVMPRVHILILNAARLYGLSANYNDDTVMKQPPEVFKAKSGHDRCMAVNHLGHYLLTMLLLPQLAPSATIVVVSSVGAFTGSHKRLMPPFGYLGKHKFNTRSSDDKRIFWEAKGIKPFANLAYQDTKYANVCFGRWLRRQLGENYTVVIHDPGLVITTPVMSRNSKAYRDRLYRGYRSNKFYEWHAPTNEGGRHLLQTAFVAQRPLPDWVVSYFFPRQVVSFFAPHEWEERKRNWYLTKFTNVQKLTWGLHGSVGPQCDPELQDRFMSWSASALGLAEPFPTDLRR